MGVLGWCSAHGSPGVTTVAVTLAATWPGQRRCLLVEADSSGGVIAARYGLGDTPGLSSLAATGRRGLAEDEVWRHAQQLPGGVPVLVGPASADEAQVVLRDVAAALGGWAAGRDEVDVIVDCGRIWPGSPTLGVLAGVDVVLVVVRPSVDQLRPASHRMAALEASGVEARLLLVGDRPYGPGEVAATLGVDVAGVIAFDPRTAAVLSGARGAVGDLRRTPLVRSAATLAEHLAASAPRSGREQHPSPEDRTVGEREVVEGVQR